MGTGAEIAAWSLAASSMAVGAASAVMQKRQAQKAAAKQKEAQEENEAATAAQQSMEQAKDDQQRRQQIRERRIKQAMIMQSAENTGAGYASGEIGGVGALSTDYYANMQYINSMGNMRTDAASAQTRANDAWFKATQYQNRGAAIGAWGGVLQSGLSSFGNIYMKGIGSSTNPYNNTVDFSNGGGSVGGDFGPDPTSTNQWSINSNGNQHRYRNYGW